MYRVGFVPQLRARVPRRVVDHWRAAGWRVHAIGQAAYAHSPDGAWHFLLGVWSRAEPPPAWADRLGRPSDGYMRRLERCWRQQAWRRMFRDARGRFIVRLPWWRWPDPILYRWEQQP